MPVIVTSGQQARRYTELHAYLTNVDAPKLAEPPVKWSHEPARPQDAPQSLSKGILLATAAPAGPVYLSLPLDDWDHDADASALGQLKSRAIDGNPVVPEQALGLLRDRLAAAQDPVMVAGPGIDTLAGWDGAVRLAEKLSLPVLVAPSPSRCPFPTRHPSFAGILPASIPTVASHFDGHDVIVAFGAAISPTTSSPTVTTCPRAPNCGPSPQIRMRRPGHRSGISSSATPQKPSSGSRTPCRAPGGRRLPANRSRRPTPLALPSPMRRSWTR